MREKRLACFFVHQAIDKPNDPNDPRVEKQLLDYDARGNLTHIQREINNPELPMDTSRESVQKLVWDEEDRLLGVDLRPESDRGQPHIAAYTYDASGERGIRYVPRQQEGVSSGATSGYAQDMDIMLYPNALVTVRPQELTEEFNFREPPPEYTFTTYTKHYYIGSERINSKLGTVNNLGLLCEEMGPSTDLINEMNDRANGANKWLEKLYHYLGKELEIATPYLYSTSHSLVCGFKSHNPKLYDAYWYHPDHLGSSSFITNTTGEISQHFEYLPFGETLVEEHLNSYNSPFKFNGKEYDAETGNYYYGARYMNPKWSTFLTPDPALESYPSISPYAYTLNNPVRYVDPTGMFVESPDNEYHVWTKNGEVTKVKEIGDKGGNNTDYITVFNEDLSPVLNNHRTELVIDLNNPENNSSIAESSLFVLSAVANYGRYREYSRFLNVWRGTNGKMYKGLSGRGPNQYTGSRGSAQARANKIGAGGAALGLLSMGLTELEYANSLKVDYGPNMRRHLDNRRVWDQSANATGFLGIFGAASSTGYNLGHLIESICNCNIQLNPYTRDFTPIEETLMMYDSMGIDLKQK